ncbi:MAG: OadG family protein [Bacteroidales bacterium]|nr:OadG family protein [Bacteroidales bacterium]
MKKFIIAMTLMVGAVSTVSASNADNFKAHDPYGWMMAIISMGVVFVALLVLFLCFKYVYNGVAFCLVRIKKLFHRQKQFEAITEKRSQRSSKMTVKDQATGAEVNDDELAAAIGVALFLHADGMHDAESDVLTLQPAASAWTGAGQNLKKSPIRKF